MDLGCTPLKAFFKVEVPEIMPGIITGMIMAFTLSLDDFVISYFTSGNSFQTLPIRIYNMTKKTVTPKMYALATIIFFAILALLIFTNLTDDNGDAKEEKTVMVKKRSRMGAALGGVLAGMVIIIGLIVYLDRNADTLVLNVYNWGEYISDGSDDSLNTVKAFESWYEKEYGQKVKVNYSTFSSNEDLYAKLSGGAVSYDVIFPSDYMISRMIEEDMLLPLNFDNIPLYSNIDEGFRGLYYDPENIYSVPYTYGIIGIIYNANVVDEEDVSGWELLWNEKYAGNILQFNNSRDAFATAQYSLGLDVNDNNHDSWEQALNKLMRQRPLVKSYVMDEVYNMMEAGEAAICAYYAGDYFTMRDAQAENVDLQFYYPHPTNYFVDAMCIPSCCQNKDLAEIFINFMLSPETALANAEYIYYASPNSSVYASEEYIEDLEDDYEILYPGIENFKELYNVYAYRNLSYEMLDYVNTLWEFLKIN